MRETLSTYKFHRLGEESLRNGIRLHLDSILLYSEERYASALQLSIIAMEEIAKAKSIEHYYFTATHNEGYPDAEFEQKWLNGLYFHPKKQFIFMGREFYRYSPKFVEHVESKKLEEQKQKATYVGLKKNKNKVDVNSRISIPINISSKETKKMISIINDELIELCKLKIEHEELFWIPGMDNWIDEEMLKIFEEWNYKSGIRSNKWSKVWNEKFKRNL